MKKRGRMAVDAIPPRPKKYTTRGRKATDLTDVLSVAKRIQSLNHRLEQAKGWHEERKELARAMRRLVKL